MARYIDVDKAIENIRNGDGTPMQKLFAECCLLVVPTADVAPKSEVAREIFEEIEKLIFVGGFTGEVSNLIILTTKDYEALKKKYTEGDK